MQKRPKKIFRHYLRWSFYSALVGLLAGASAALFLISLNWATKYRSKNMWLIWLLPFAGLFIGYCYKRYGRKAQEGTGLILEEIHNPQNIIPFRMAPFVFIGTVITHLFGGSAGREGTAVQMGSTFADQLTQFFQIEPEERKILLIAGAGAGFSAAIGAPLAGAIFGLEVIQIGKLRLFALFECLIASFVGFHTSRVLGAPHSIFPVLNVVTYDVATVVSVFLGGLAFGMAANIFVKCTHLVERIQKKYIKISVLRPFFAGIALIILYYIEGSYRYVGLGIPTIQNSFTQSASWYDPIIKLIFTSLTIGSGFKGGEFVPLVFIGSTLGSFLSTQMMISKGLITSLGFAAVFGAAANTPIACTIMACELFGWKIAPYALFCCLIAYYITGHLGIYKNQKIVYSKNDQLLSVFNWPRQFMKLFKQPR